MKASDLYPMGTKCATIAVVCNMKTWREHYKALAAKSRDRYLHVPINSDHARVMGLEVTKIIVHGDVTEMQPELYTWLRHRAGRSGCLGLYMEMYV